MRQPSPSACLLFCLLLAGCERGPPFAAVAPVPIQETRGDTGPSSNPDPRGLATADASATCELLAGVDLQAALGEPPAAPRASGSQCTVHTAQAGSPASLHVQFLQRGGAAVYAQQNALLGVEHAIDGLGEEAVATGNRVHARAGDTFLGVQLVRNPVGPARQASVEEVTALARALADNAGW